MLLLLSLTKCFSQEPKDEKIRIIEDLLNTLNTKKTNSDVITLYCIHDYYFKNDTIRKIADSWIDHVRMSSKNKETFIIRKYDPEQSNIEFGLTDIATGQVESIKPTGIYEFLSDNTKGILYLYFHANNKIISFSAFNLNNRVAFIPY